MGVGSGEQEGAVAPLDFHFIHLIHRTNIVHRGLKVLFFGVFSLFFGLCSVASPPLLEEA